MALTSFNSGAGSKFRKSNWNSVWQGRRAFDLFAERDEKIYSAQCRLVSTIYSLEALLDLEPYIDDSIPLMLSKLSEMATQVLSVNLWAQLFALYKDAFSTFTR